MAEFKGSHSLREANKKACAEYRSRNLEARRLADREYSKIYRENNPGAHKKWRESSKVKKHLAAYMCEWRKTARTTRRNKGDKRTAKCTPPWANRFFIGEIYALARLRTKVTGIPWEVDHIIPLNGKTVCGLHVENNLCVIPRSMNRAKKNKFLG